MALPRRNWHALSVAFASAAVLAAVSLAGVFNPLSGISAADHPKTPSDVLSPGVQGQLRADSPPSGGVDQIGGRLTDSARLVGTLPSGRKVSVVASTKGRLCVVVALLAESCSDPLTAAKPVTFTVAWERPGAPAYAYGVARDGVRSVSFSYGGHHVTVPVEHNFFAYETGPLDAAPGFGALTVTSDDGQTRSIR